MESLALKAAEQVPNLAVLSFIVWLFLKSLREHNESSAQRQLEQAAVLTDLNFQSRQLNQQNQKVIEANTIAATRNTMALQDNSRHLEDFAKSARK